jgi:hypothetical protein
LTIWASDLSAKGERDFSEVIVMHVLRRSPLPRTLAVTVAAGLLAIVISLLLMLGPLATGQDSTVALHPAQQMSGVTQPAVTQSGPHRRVG